MSSYHKIDPAKLRALRLSAGFKTQKDLANYIDCYPQTVSEWERGVTKVPFILIRLLMQMSTTSLSDMVDFGLMTNQELVLSLSPDHNFRRPL